MFKKSYQIYIGLGLILNSMAFLMFEGGIIVNVIKLCLYSASISLEIFGVVKYRQGLHGKK